MPATCPDCESTLRIVGTRGLLVIFACSYCPRTTIAIRDPDCGAG